MLAFETLESRKLLSSAVAPLIDLSRWVQIQIDQRVLHIQGTSQADFITLLEADGFLFVHTSRPHLFIDLSEISAPQVHPAPVMEEAEIALRKIDLVSVTAGKGNDVVQADASVQTPLLISGDDGSDTLFGGSGNDSIVGGHGNDLLIGNSGNDLLDGGSGRNLLSSGIGKDRVLSLSINDVFSQLEVPPAPKYSGLTVTSLMSSFDGVALSKQDGELVIDTGFTFHNLNASIEWGQLKRDGNNFELSLSVSSKALVAKPSVTAIHSKHETFSLGKLKEGDYTLTIRSGSTILKSVTFNPASVQEGRPDQSGVIEQQLPTLADILVDPIAALRSFLDSDLFSEKVIAVSSENFVG